ncbi:preprotein translocase subunit SecG [Telluria aromaticivorans]|uniref:Protein-export membrane protein SecG n=1 Tax=Telluria aromaticivorans TaxID=2725995 RepID=A0A7Y2JW79_9BURK|nr:preprotein translocase subunit SecG [Telluria aromaticivorans]NNG22185.1 preprotein translocase subunit SecG [Telluria aromaticivorans]
MNTLFNLVIVVQVISALAIIGLVLVQHGKGADMGAAFGSGASGSLFGASGSSNFLSKSTAVAAAIFFASTLALAYFSNNRTAGPDGGVMERVTVPSSKAPATGIPSDIPGAGPNAGATTVVPANDIPQTPGVAIPAAPGQAAPAPAAPAAATPVAPAPAPATK